MLSGLSLVPDDRGGSKGGSFLGDRFFQNFDWLIVFPVILLIGIGLLALYSVGHVPADLKEAFQAWESPFFEKQLVWSLLGLVVLVLALLIPFRYYESSGVLFYFIGLSLLVVVLALEPSKKASRWIVLGGFRFQPSEFMKIAVIFLLARFLAEKRNNPNSLRVMAVSLNINTCGPNSRTYRWPS